MNMNWRGLGNLIGSALALGGVTFATGAFVQGQPLEQAGMQAAFTALVALVQHLRRVPTVQSLLPFVGSGTRTH